MTDRQAGRISDPEATLRPGSREQVKVRGSALPFLAPPLRPDEIGRLGPYRVLRILGQGMMGIVLQGEDPSLNRPVALKVMQPEVAARADMRQRFLQEACAAGALQHDNIVPIYHVGEDEGVLYLVMPLLKGMTLDEYLRKGRKLSVNQVLRVGRDVARGLACAHAAGLIHRDIKPANLWVDGSTGGRIKILDFGLSRPVQTNAQLTASGMVVGSPAFMAPEQINGRPEPRSDLYSLGSVLYRLLSGRLPFTQPDPLDLMVAVATQPPPPLRAVAPHVPEDLDALVMRLLAKNPEDRPPSAAVLMEELKSIARVTLGSGEAEASMLPVLPVDDSPTEMLDAPSPPSRQMKKKRRKKPLAWLAPVLIGFAALALVLAGVGLARLLPSRQGQKIDQTQNREKEKESEKEKGKVKEEPKFVSLLAARPPETPLDNFQQMGKGDLRLWEIRDEQVKCKASRFFDRGMLVTRKTYGDFELEMEWRLPEGGKSGVFLRLTSLEPPLKGKTQNNGALGIEVRLSDDASMPKPEGVEGCGAIARLLSPLKPAYLGADKWNPMQIRCEGDHVLVTLNNTRVIDTNKQGRIKDLPARGVIGFHAMGTGVEFRNIRIREPR